MIVLPIRNDIPHQTFSTELEGVTYGFEFRWNDRASAWFCTIKTAEEETIVSNRKVVLNRPLFIRFTDERLPPGPIIALDTSGQDLAPGLEDLGPDGRVLVYYVSTSDES